MKHLMIALMAFTLTLGMSCKKENVNSVKSSSEIVKKEVAPVDTKIEVSGVVDPTSPGAPGGGADSYPHNTGGCTCGKYASCFPEYYMVATYDTNTGFYQNIMHKTAYGQTTFPPGATFPGNTPQN